MIFCSQHLVIDMVKVVDDIEMIREQLYWVFGSVFNQTYFRIIYILVEHDK